MQMPATKVATQPYESRHRKALDSSAAVSSSSILMPRQGPDREVRDGALLFDGLGKPGAMRKREFLETLRSEIHSVAELELAGTGWTAEHCPWIEYWFDYYGRRSAFDVEAALRKFVPTIVDAQHASEYVAPIIERVRRAIARWRVTGEVDGPALEVPDVYKVQAALGPGVPLESSVRSRMEDAMQTDLGDVRIHANSHGARVAAQENATALAIGSHIAFAGGAYQPHSPTGEILLAHELAHTVQQRGALSTGVPGPGPEVDANRSTVGVIGRLWGAAKSYFAPAPQVRTGLQLQRCKKDDRLLAPAKGDIPDYDSFSDASGVVPSRGPKAEALGAMFQNPTQLDRVFADAASGNARARKVVEQLHQDFEFAGALVAETEGQVDCLIPAWRELKTVVTTGCEVTSWSQFDFLKADHAGGAALREDVARSYSKRARELGVRNTIIVNSLNLFLAGWQAKASLAGEARALDAKANQPPTRPLPDPVAVPEALADLKAAEAAEEAHLPTPPDGYRWAQKDGVFTVNRMPGRTKDLPQLKYDPATREFVNVEEFKPPKPAVVRPGPPPVELETVAEEAVAARDAIVDPGKKTTARTPDGTTKTSGWGSDVTSLDPVAELSKKIGHEPKPSPRLDAAGKPGSYNNSHAEKQVAAATNGDQAIGVSREMCMDCQHFFQRLANYKNKPIVVADPTGIRVFFPDGTVVSAITVAGLLAATAAKTNANKAQP
jgi:hypothetical protein